MKTSEKQKAILDKIEANHKVKKNAHTYAESIAILLKDKLVEVHVGDMFETIKLEDHEFNMPCLYVGVVIGALDDCLVLKGYKFDLENKTKKLGNFLFINGFSIKAISEIDGSGSISDCWLGHHRNVKNFKIVPSE